MCSVEMKIGSIFQLGHPFYIASKPSRWGKEWDGWGVRMVGSVTGRVGRRGVPSEGVASRLTPKGRGGGAAPGFRSSLGGFRISGGKPGGGAAAGTPCPAAGRGGGRRGRPPGGGAAGAPSREIFSDQHCVTQTRDSSFEF